MTTYVPLNARERGEVLDQRKLLHDALPLGVRDRMRDWLREALGGPGFWNEEALQWLALDLQTSLEPSTGEWPGMRRGQVLLARCLTDERLFLDAIDWVLQHGYCNADAIAELSQMLDRGKVTWRVLRSGRTARLERRVLETLNAVAEVAANRESRAALHLGTAWDYAWGGSPNPREAYRHAIIALESALRGVVPGAAPDADLGSLIAQVRREAPRYTVRADPTRGSEGVARFLAAVELVWCGRPPEEQDGVTALRSVTPEQAQDAVALASALVQWVESEAFRRG